MLLTGRCFCRHMVIENMPSTILIFLCPYMVSLKGKYLCDRNPQHWLSIRGSPVKGNFRMDLGTLVKEYFAKFRVCHNIYINVDSMWLPAKPYDQHFHANHRTIHILRNNSCAKTSNASIFYQSFTDFKKLKPSL